jgi:hypothetical protein
VSSANRSKELVDALNLIANEIGVKETIEIDHRLKWAENNKRRILRALQSAKIKKLRRARCGELLPTTKTRYYPDVEWATHLVNWSLKKHPWARGQKPSDEAVSQIQARAIQILSGVSKAKSRKNFIEAHAVKLVEQVRLEWFTPIGKKGRPEGARAKSGIRIKDLHYQVPLSPFEIVCIVMPIIEELAGVKLKVISMSSALAARSPTFAALVAAVRTEIPNVEIASVARTVMRVRKHLLSVN